jgi:hypothetical protein
MVEFEIKIHPKQRQAYIPKEIVETLGTHLKAKPGSYAVLLYPKNVDPDLVERSVKILLADLKLESKTERRSHDQKVEAPGRA